MALLLNGGARLRPARYKPLAEINVTPLVDVMLVLLIIFMVTAPLMSTAVNVDLPKVATSPVNQDSQPLTISVDAQGQVFLQDQKVDLPDLVTRLQALVQDNKDRRIFVRGDKDLPYGRIMEIMGIITQGGFTHVALLAEQTGPGAPSTNPPASSAPASRPGRPKPG